MERVPPKVPEVRSRPMKAVARTTSGQGIMLLVSGVPVLDPFPLPSPILHRAVSVERRRFVTEVTPAIYRVVRGPQGEAEVIHINGNFPIQVLVAGPISVEPRLLVTTLGVDLSQTDGTEGG